MDRLFSAFGLYEVISLVLTGATLISGVWWTAAGIPDEPGAATLVALTAASFIVGHAVQSLGTLWEKRYWRLRGAWPSSQRMSPDSPRAFDPALRSMITDAL